MLYSSICLKIKRNNFTVFSQLNDSFFSKAMMLASMFSMLLGVLLLALGLSQVAP